MSVGADVSPEAWRASGDFFTWRDQQIFVRTGGAGEPLLLVHGFPTASWDWAPIWDALTVHYRVIALDLIGFGFSAKPHRFHYAITVQADLVDALLAREGVTRYRLLAHDYGDSVAQELLARQREGAAARLERVCLLNGGLFPETHRAVTTQKLLASSLGPLVARLITYRGFSKTMRSICARPLDERELRGMWQLANRDGGVALMPKLIGYIAERRRTRARWVGALIDAPVPVRLVVGPDDPISGAHMIARYRELVPRADVVELAGVGHYPQLEAPDRVLPPVLDFFA